MHTFSTNHATERGMHACTTHAAVQLILVRGQKLWASKSNKVAIVQRCAVWAVLLVAMR